MPANKIILFQIKMAYQKLKRFRLEKPGRIDPCLPSGNTFAGGQQLNQGGSGGR